MNKLSLYLHIPFCRQKCDYCDFFSVPSQKKDNLDNYLDVYIEALLQETEWRLRIHQCDSVPSVYIGGGTPSLLGARGITRLLQGLKSFSCIDKYLPLKTADTYTIDDIKTSSISNCAEITVEANPETADERFLRACADNGITRLSLGAQSFDSGLRSFIGRQGDASLLNARLSAASEIFGKRLSLDLMSCGYFPPNASFDQKRETLIKDIEQTLKLNPGHVSLYALSLEQGTPLADRLANATAPIQEDADKLWLAGRDTLIKAGFEHYEVSNFALRNNHCGNTNDNRCLHNIRYWRMYNWIGIGPGASGTIINDDGIGCRTAYAPDINAFMMQSKENALLENTTANNSLQSEKLDRLTVIKETILMGYRYKEGPDKDLFIKRFGKPIHEFIPKTLAKWQKEETMLFLNSFLLDSFLELDNTYIDE